MRDAQNVDVLSSGSDSSPEEGTPATEPGLTGGDDAPDVAQSENDGSDEPGLADGADVGSRRPTGGRIAPLWISLVIAAAIAAIDQVSKRWMLANLRPGGCDQPDACIEVFGGLRFNLVFNTGASFSAGGDFGPYLGVLAVIMTLVLVYLSTKQTSRILVGLYGSVAGGAIGNLIDRVYRADDGLLSGAVVDFIDLGWWPVFNVADSAIVIGVIGIIGMSLFRPEAQTEGTERHLAEDDATDQRR